MVLKIFTKEDAPEMRDAIDLGKRLEEEGFEVEFLDFDDANATSQIELYDIYSFPAFIIATNEGQALHDWRESKPGEGELRQLLSE